VREDTGLPIATAERYAADRADWRRTSYMETARGRTALRN